ncbi:MAG: zf-HC2 domain-containing protein [Chloroflexi bacterium]|nr:zf-HC2 domain-containing protein [Chloroflexota bacterium]
MLFWRNRHEVRDEELNALVDGELDESARRHVERHIESCSPCSAAVAELRAVSRAMSELPAVPAPRSFALRRVDVEPAQTPAPSRLFDSVQPLLSGVAAMAIIAFVVLAAVDTGSESSQSDDSGAASIDSVAESELSTAEPNDLADDDTASEARGYSFYTQDGNANHDDESSVEANGITSDTDKPGAPEQESLLGDDVRGPQPGEGVGEFGQGGIAAAPAADDGNNVGLRVAESVAAAVALTAGGSVLLIWWRRRATAG